MTVPFPSEDNLPTDTQAIRELIEAARDANLSYRYVNVLRHRLMDAVIRDMDEGRL